MAHWQKGIMRKGTNPEKNNSYVRPIAHHRIILPVYIPTLSGYYENLLEILALSLESLCLSTKDKGYVTVVSNGCSSTVVEKLREWYGAGWFHQLVINKENLGKVDGTVSLARGSVEEFITISDSDVLFRPGWIQEVEHIFATFPEAGFVSPTPAPHLVWNYTSATILGGLLNRELFFGDYVSEDAMQKFAESVGTPSFIKGNQYVVQRGATLACVGAGHFVFTIRKKLLEGIPKDASRTTLSCDADKIWFDIPPDRMGYWRLSTLQGFAYHMGNTPEPWMYEELDRYRYLSSTSSALPDMVSKRSLVRFVPLELRLHITNFLKRTSFINSLVNHKQ